MSPRGLRHDASLRTLSEEELLIVLQREVDRYMSDAKAATALGVSRLIGERDTLRVQLDELRKQFEILAGIRE